MKDKEIREIIRQYRGAIRVLRKTNLEGDLETAYSRLFFYQDLLWKRGKLRRALNRSPK